MAGTATTIDALNANGLFRGGLILPGLSLMRAALARNTADLPHAAGHYRPHPTNTDDAIVSGAIHATLGAIERMRSTLDEDALCLLSGGAAAELAPHFGVPHRLIGQPGARGSGALQPDPIALGHCSRLACGHWTGIRSMPAAEEADRDQHQQDQADGDQHQAEHLRAEREGRRRRIHQILLELTRSPSGARTGPGAHA